MNVRPKNDAPVWGDSGVHVDEDLAAIAEEVADIIKSKLRSQLKAAKDPAQTLELSQHILNLEPDDPEVLKAHEGARRQLDLDIRACRQRAKDAFAERRYDDAIAQWKALLELAPDDEEAKDSVARIQNLLELRRHLRELEGAVAAGKDEEAVRSWKRVSPLLAEDVLSTYEKRLASLTQDVEVSDQEIERLKLEIQRLRATLDVRDQRICELEAELREAQEELKRLPPKLPTELVYRDWKIYCERDGAEMVMIPAGEFSMGSDDGVDNEKPVHPVSLDAFYMDVYPVTVGRYRRFIEATGYHHAPDWKGVAEYAPTDDHPIIHVNWHDAMAYCKWAGKILPTEAQWEYAARGGLEGKKYPWGDEAPDNTRANCGGKVGKTTPVGTYPPNGYGLYDMAGNVWEWCMDEYNSDFYKKSPKANPVAGGIITLDNYNFTNVKNLRVCRGGGWNDRPYYVRVADRLNSFPTLTYYYFGFRCAGFFTP